MSDTTDDWAAKAAGSIGLDVHMCGLAEARDRIAKVLRDERERCAKICEDTVVWPPRSHLPQYVAADALLSAAKRIRDGRPAK